MNKTIIFGRTVVPNTDREIGANVNSEVKTYMLSKAELNRYRRLPPPDQTGRYFTFTK